MASIAPAPVTLQAKPLAPTTPASGQTLVTQSQQQQQHQPTQMKITMPVAQGQQVSHNKASSGRKRECIIESDLSDTKSGCVK